MISKQHRDNVCANISQATKCKIIFFSLKLKIKKVEKKGAKIFSLGRMSKVKTRWETQQPPFCSLTWKQHRNDVLHKMSFANNKMKKTNFLKLQVENKQS